MGKRHGKMIVSDKIMSEAPELPKSIANTVGRFEGGSIKEAPELPKSVAGMFADCRSIKEAPELPKGIEDTVGRFEAGITDSHNQRDDASDMISQYDSDSKDSGLTIV